jgi:hypothetical protein
VSSVPARVPAATTADQPTPEGERALRQALGYIDGADAPGTRRVYAAGWRHFNARCLAAIAWVHREARHLFDARDPAVRNALIQPDGVADDHGWEAVASIGRLGRWQAHSGCLSAAVPPAKFQLNLTVPFARRCVRSEA